ncbi:response regulator [Ferrovibrio sp.]|uniref:response regulator n=1 Tax=Ferrovibrio sp. TaxID=1917215 RepID=UPI0025C07861|nr:response regulator [Ferrovibrio sp.]MBX3456496.1 response regulator [Ferrovibrio sp.]
MGKPYQPQLRNLIAAIDGEARRSMVPVFAALELLNQPLPPDNALDLLDRALVATDRMHERLALLRSQIANLSDQTGDAAGMPSASSVALLRHRHVLLAEDSKTSQLVLTMLLRAGGAEVRVVADGKAAVQEISEHGRYFDAVLMDLHMPVMDGMEATRAIRALPGPANAVPIIGITAEEQPERLAAFRAAGMQDVLTKPVDLAALYRTLSQVLHPPA